MGMFGRFLAGAGEGASQIASKYLDEQFAEQRAQVLANIQRDSAMQMDQYTNSDERRGRMRDLEGQDLIAKAGATDTAALATLNNTPLMEANIRRTNEVTRGTMGAAAEAAGMKEGAIERNKPQKVTPGEDLVVNGVSIFHNSTMTPAEASLAAYREGLKGKKAEDRDRITELTLSSFSKRLDDNQKDLDKLLAEFPDAMTPPKPGETHWYGDKSAEKKPAYDNYQRLLRERAMLTQGFNAISQAHANGGSAPGGGADPLGILGGKPAIMGAAGAGEAAEQRTMLSRQAAAFRAKLADPDLPEAERAKTEQELRVLIAQPEMQGVDISAPAPGAGSVASPADPLQAKYAARLAELKAHPTATAAGGPSIMGAVGAAEIPPPPQRYGYNGNARAENPEWKRWNSRYSMAAYEEQERLKEEEAQRQGEASRQLIEQRRGSVGMRGNV